MKDFFPPHLSSWTSPTLDHRLRSSTEEGWKDWPPPRAIPATLGRQNELKAGMYSQCKMAFSCCRKQEQWRKGPQSGVQRESSSFLVCWAPSSFLHRGQRCCLQAWAAEPFTGWQAEFTCLKVPRGSLSCKQASTIPNSLCRAQRGVKDWPRARQPPVSKGKLRNP